MAGLGAYNIDDTLTFYATTHDPSTSGSADATSINYEVYEQTTGTPIVASTAMSKLNDAGTLGFYANSLTLSAANGYEDGKDYGILIEATVGGVAAATHHHFRVKVLDVNAVEISGDSAAADNAESFFDGTGYAGTNNVIPTVTTLTGHTPQTGDNYARLGAPAGASVSADIAALPAATDIVSGGAITTSGGAVSNVTLVATTTTNTDMRGTDSANTTTPPTTGQITAAILAAAYEGSTTVQDFLRLVSSAQFAKLAGAGTTTVTIRDIADTKARITATVDADGNRTAITTDTT